MDQVKRVRKYIKREQWKTLIQECQSSGMTHYSLAERQLARLFMWK